MFTTMNIQIMNVEVCLTIIKNLNLLLDLSRRDNKSTQRDNEKEYTRIQPTSSRLFVNNSNENKRYYYSEFNHTQSSNYKNFCSRQIYDGINQDLKYRRHSFTG